ncbi:MAG: HNH endonuclease [Alphaproteobacteria bacterium]|nr:HNH endonuclease [Alphaproteobacteria bacterium]
MVVVERMLQLLQHGSFQSTYKYAVLIGIMDLCVEMTSARGWPPQVLTTRQLAEKVVALYWPQVRAWDGGRLAQTRNRDAAIPKAVAALRDAATAEVSAGAGVGRVAAAMPKRYAATVDAVELRLVTQPLPRLQRINGEDTGWLYDIAWDLDHLPTAGQIRRRDFDNRLHLRPDVATTFARLHGLLRPFVEEAWARHVARVNALEQDRLRQFLFGASRADLEPVRAPLLDLQAGRCFFCEDRLTAKAAVVDHFIPWSRHPDNGLENLVVAHADCNNHKRDHLAAAPHVARWRARDPDALAQLAAAHRWEAPHDRTLGAARGLYLGLPEGSRLWLEGRTFERVDPRALRPLLR